MMEYHIYDAISGNSADIKAYSPKDAAIRYLKQDVEPNPKSNNWVWELNICEIPNKG